MRECLRLFNLIVINKVFIWFIITFNKELNLRVLLNLLDNHYHLEKLAELMD